MALARSQQALEGEAPSPGAEIGARLREERKRQGLSLSTLAERLAVTVSALSQIETGRSRPSVSTLWGIVTELGMSFDELFANSPRPHGSTTSHPRPVSRQAQIAQRFEDRPVIELESGVTWERLNPIGDHDVDFVDVEYPVGGESSHGGKFIQHAGREYGVVTSGTLKVTVGFEEYELRPGDSICFDSSVPHRLETVGDEPAKAFWLVIGRAGSDARVRWQPE
jgi:transcriptional regulator with XRE-family HTH domain